MRHKRPIQTLCLSEYIADTPPYHSFVCEPYGHLIYPFARMILDPPTYFLGHARVTLMLTNAGRVKGEDSGVRHILCAVDYVLVCRGATCSIVPGLSRLTWVTRDADVNVIALGIVFRD